MQPINWFPGHMNKTRKKMIEIQPNIEMVIEILDARIPLASRAPVIYESTKEKPRLILLNKADLAMEGATAAWIKYYKEQKNTIVKPVNSSRQNPLPSFASECLRLVKQHKPNHQGPVRALIAGIPNVGKSSFINGIKKQKKTGVQNKPGHTKDFQRVVISKDLVIIDTPGIMWTKLQNQDAAVRLAICGAINDKILDIPMIAEKASRFLAERYPEKLKERYRITEIPEGEFEILDLIGRKRGFLQKGGVVDFDRACALLLTEIREGKLGRITWEMPRDYGEEN